MNEPSSEPSVLVEEFHLGLEGRMADTSAVAVLVAVPSGLPERHRLGDVKAA